MPQDPSEKISDAIRVYFAANGFKPDGGYSDDFVVVKIGPIPVAFPNTKARKRAVPHHDIHHVVTGFATTLRGEGEIGAWEIASSCADHYAAWLLNLGAMAIGLYIAPVRMWRAFLRGRHSGNTYRMAYDAQLLGKSVGELQHELRLDKAVAAATLADKFAFFGWASLALWTGALQIGLYMLPLLLVAWGIWRWLH